MRSAQLVASWVLALFLIAVYLQATIHPLPNPPEGSVKLFDPPGQNIVFETLSQKSRYIMFEPTGRVFTALMELLAAVLLLLPFSRRFGAFLSAMIMFVAVGLHMSPWLGREVPLSLDPSNTATDGGALFALAVSMLVASVLLFAIHPKRKRLRGF